MDLPHRLYMALGPLADPPKWNHSMVSIPDSVPVVYSLWWIKLDRVPNCSKWFECSDVLSGLAAVMLKGFYLHFQHTGVSSPKAMGRLPKRQGDKLEEWLLAISFWSIQVKNQCCVWRKGGGLCWLLSKRLSPFFSHFCSSVLWLLFPFTHLCPITDLPCLQSYHKKPVICLCLDPSILIHSPCAPSLVYLLSLSISPPVKQNLCSVE